MWRTWTLLGALAFFAAETGAEDCGGSGTEGILVTEESGSYTCQPDSGGPFPGVLYSHGGKNGLVGGDLHLLEDFVETVEVEAQGAREGVQHEP